MLNCLLSDLANIEYNNALAPITKKNAEKWMMITTHYLWYTFIDDAKNRKIAVSLRIPIIIYILKMLSNKLILFLIKDSVLLQFK